MVQAAAIQATLLNCFASPPAAAASQQQSYSSSEGDKLYHHNSWSYGAAAATAVYPQAYDQAQTTTQPAYFLPQQTTANYQVYPQQYPPAFK